MCIVSSFLEATLILLVDVALFDKITADLVGMSATPAFTLKPAARSSCYNSALLFVSW